MYPIHQPAVHMVVLSNVCPAILYEAQGHD
jgi:hypothetical protein